LRCASLASLKRDSTLLVDQLYSFFAVFKEHEETFELASASSKAALDEMEKCNKTKA
jgi:hypothetical protein